MPLVTQQERLYALTLPRHWSPPSFSFNQYVRWSLDKSSHYCGSGWIIGINHDVEANSKGDGYFYNIMVDPNAQCYQEWSIAHDDLTPILETCYSYQLTAVSCDEAAKP